MGSTSIVKYILIGVLACAAFVTGFAFLNTLIHEGRTFADGFKNVIDWILGVCFGASCAYSVWKKDNGKDKDSEKKQ